MFFSGVLILVAQKFHSDKPINFPFLKLNLLKNLLKIDILNVYEYHVSEFQKRQKNGSQICEPFELPVFFERNDNLANSLKVRRFRV